MSSQTLSPRKPEVPILRVPFDAEDRRFIADGLNKILDTGAMTMAGFTKAFEEESAALFGVPHAVAVANATCAIEIVLRAVGVEGGTVIVPANTFAATALAAVHAGAKVVFADCDPKTFSLDVADVKKRLRPDTKAVIVVHIGGIITPAIKELKALCAEKGIALVEDCAHAHGSRLDGVAAGAWGQAGCFSYFPTKVLVSGEGGLITTADKKLDAAARILRNHGKNPELKNRISEPGYNWRLSEITALVALQQTRKAGALFKERQAVAAYYDANLGDLKKAKPLSLPKGLESTYYKYIVMLEPGVDRAALKAAMKERGVSLTGEVYDLPLNQEPVWAKHPGLALNAGEAFPGASELAARHVCLPLYPGLSQDELAHVVASLKECLG